MESEPAVLKETSPPWLLNYFYKIFMVKCKRPDGSAFENVHMYVKFGNCIQINMLVELGKPKKKLKIIMTLFFTFIEKGNQRDKAKNHSS